ncbi:COPB2 isoform 12, partial [Pongo abelii]
LADPTEYENLFPGLKEAFVVEEWVKETHADLWPAKQYPLVTPNEERNVMEEAKGFQPSISTAQQELDGKPASPTPVIVASHTANKEEKQPDPWPLEPTGRLDGACDTAGPSWLHHRF